MEKETYRNQIQELIEQMNHIYEACGNLRDFATFEEKEAWNRTRGLFYNNVQHHLRVLDNTISNERANELLPNYAKRIEK